MTWRCTWDWPGSAGVCLAGRRRWPLASLATTMCSLLLVLPTMHSTHTALAVAMVSAATVAYQGKRQVTVAVGVALIPVVALAWWIAGGDGVGQEFFTYLVLVLAAVVAGDAVRSRRDVGVVRREREALARQGAAREMFNAYRLELGRELHDSLAHALVAITTRSGVAAHIGAAGGDPALLAALADVKQVSADALAELRQTLNSLRTDGAPAPIGPGRPAREAFTALVRPLSTAGLTVRLDCDAAADVVPQAVSHAGYRIVQESLTNVLRHGQARTVTVTVLVLDDQWRSMWSTTARWRRHPPTVSPATVYRGMAERATHGWHCPSRSPYPRRVARQRAAADDRHRAMTTVLIADDQAMVRGGFKALLAAEPDMSVVAEAGDGEAAVALTRRHKPDVVLMDIRMPRLDGLAATRQITADATQRHSSPDPHDVRPGRVRLRGTPRRCQRLPAQRHGPSRPHRRRPRHRLRARRCSHPPPPADSSKRSPARRRHPSRRPSTLAPDVTDREREVLALLAQGLANAEIANRLVISPFTVKSHISSLLTRHALRDRVQLVVLAYESGLVKPGD